MTRLYPTPRLPWTALTTLLLVVLTGCGTVEAPALWGSGTLEAQEVTLSSLVGGRLLGRPVSEGDQVGQGALLAWVDSAAVTEQRELARVGLLRLAVERRQASSVLASSVERLHQAERTRDRLLVLRQQDAVPQAQLDDAGTAVTLADRQVESARTAIDALEVEGRRIRLQIASLDRQITEYLILAPSGGTVLTTYMEVGEVAAPGKPILRIADTRRLHVRIYLPAALIGRVELGGEARVRVDAWPDEIFEGRVVHIASEAEFTPRNVQTAEARADLVFAVKVAVSNPEGRLKIGLPADVDLPGITPTP